MTGQPTEVKRLPKDLREALPAELAAKSRIYAKDLPDDIRDEVWARFADALEPLGRGRPAGLDPAPVPALVLHQLGEPRHDRGRDGPAAVPPAWSARSSSGAPAGSTRRTSSGRCAFLGDRAIPLVVVDGPQGFKSSVPPVVAAPSPDLAIVRFHGRRGATWEAKGVQTVERFRYLYDETELADWAPRVRDIAAQARDTHVLFNNCYANYGSTNALELARLLEDLQAPEPA